jgi:LPXTG-motif cell wall-anchored protein
MLILSPSVAMAYEAPGFSSSVSDSTPAIGQSVSMTVNGGAANAGQMIKLVITGDDSTRSMSQRADATGSVKFTFTLSDAGRYEARAFNAAGALVSGPQILTVASQSNSGLPPTNSGLPPSGQGGQGDQLGKTGFEGMPLAVGGGVLILAGAGAVLVARRRRSAQVPA